MSGRFGGIVAVIIAVAGMAACSGTGSTSHGPSTSSATASRDLSNVSASDMLTRAAAYLRQVHAFGLVGGGVTAGAGQLRIDYRFVGADSAGTLARGPSYEVRSVQGARYVKPSDAMWTRLVGRNASAYVAQYRDKWLRVQPTNATFRSLTDLADRGAAVDSLFHPRTSVRKLDGTAIIRGVVCVGIVVATGADSTLYLAADDLRPMAVVNTGQDSGRIDFTYSGLAPITAPPASALVDAPMVPKLQD